jgi:hypothetical protein
MAIRHRQRQPIKHTHGNSDKGQRALALLEEHQENIVLPGLAFFGWNSAERGVEHVRLILRGEEF